MALIPQAAVYLGSPASTTLATAVDTNLLLPVAAGEIWIMQADLPGSSALGGIRYAFTAPAGTTIEGWLFGAQAGVGPNSFLGQRITALGSLTIANPTTITMVSARVRIAVGGASGNFRVQIANQLAGSAATLARGASLWGRLAAAV